MSISKSQAQALADGFLNDLGDEKEGLQPRETFTELFLLAGEFIEDMQDNLNKDNSNASGKLSSSIELNDPVQSGSTVKIDVSMNFYGKFINAGVKGTKSGSGKYAFKNSYPNRKMVAQLLLGIRRARKSSANVNKSKSISKNEIKNKTIGDMDHAWGAARNIKMYGIKATGFIDKAIVTTTAKVEDRLGAALEVDVYNSI